MGAENWQDATPTSPGRTIAEWHRPRAARLGGLVTKVLAIVIVGVLVTWIATWPQTPHAAAPSAAPSTAPAEPPAPATGTPGSEWLKEYAKVDAGDEGARHRVVLEQIARRNMPDTWDDWVTVTVTGKKGTIVEFDVSPHGLRIGTNEDWVEVPMDGPHFAAAAEILELSLATAWMVRQIHFRAKTQGGLVHYFAAAEIAQSMGYVQWQPNAPDGQTMKSPEFFAERSRLIREWLATHQIEDNVLISGYFKTIVPPIDGLTRRQGLEMLGGYSDEGEQVQPLSGGFHTKTFFDYSHNVRLAKNVVRVNGQTLTLAQFWDSVKHALEFGFRRSSVPDPAYRYPKALARWMKANRRAEK
jgi:hypothetical protein